jgi:hypothetical protein
LKLKGIFAVELISIVIIVVLVLIFVEVTPYLASANQNSSIGVYNQKLFVQGTARVSSSEIASAQFNYSTYDPAILVIDLTFKTWENPGPLSLLCNGRTIATILATPASPRAHFTTISVSGWDWVKPPSIDAYTYGNEVTFVPEPSGGYEGTFSYQISIRGSR